MKKIIFSFSFFTILLMNIPAFADNLKRFVDSKPYQDFNKKTDIKISAINKKWVIPEGTYGSLFATDKSIKQIHDWLTTKSNFFLAKEKIDSIVDNTYFLQQNYTVDGHAPLKVEIYVPHPRNVDDAEFGLLEAYRKLTPQAMNVDVQEKIKIQKYDAMQYEIKDKTCRILIKMPHEVRVYLIGQLDDLDMLYKLGDELSLTRLEMKLEN